MDQYQTPGVYLREIFPVPAAGLPTGVPAFLGYAAAGPIASETALEQAPQMLRLGTEFEKLFGAPLQNSYLASAVRGYFENDGRLCYVVRLDDTLDAVAALRLGLEALRPLDSIDLICAPDIMRSPAGGASPPNPDTVYALQKAVLEHCDAAGDRFAILDSLPLVSGSVVDQRQGLQGNNGALYYPWVGVAAGASLAGGLVPPCGHVAGVYTRSDQRVGVHKAPANEILKGVLDLEVNLSNAQQAELNPAGINCLRAFPGRGILVWGGRTLSADPTWAYISVRRLFLTAGRWIERNMADTVYEPNDSRLWARIERELRSYFEGLFRRGALNGRTLQEAFYIKCDGDLNPPAVRNTGQVVVEIGLAPAVPNEFVVVHIIQNAAGITITGPSVPQ